MDSEDVGGCSGGSITSEKEKGEKRAYLEVNEADKYKGFMLKQLETKRLKPSDALEKLKQFLPTFKESTEKLINDNKDDLTKIDIENVDDNEQNYIEMSLAFVPEKNSKANSNGDEDDDDDTVSDTSDEDSDEEDNDDDDDDDDSDISDESKGAKAEQTDGDFLENFVNNELINLEQSKSIKITPQIGSNKKTKKPRIDVIQSQNNDDDTSSNEDD